MLGDCNSLPWSVGAIVVPYNLWRHHGDTRPIQEYWSRMQLFMRWAESTADNTTGLVTVNGLGDCNSPSGVSEDGIPAQVASFAQLLAWRMMAEMAEAIGRHDDMEAAQQMVTNITTAYRAAYSQRCEKTASFFEFFLCLSRACLGKMFVFICKWRKNAVLRRNGSYLYQGKGVDGAQVANSMALWVDVPAAEDIPAVVETLVKDIEKRGDHLSTGTIGTRTLFEALSMHNETEVAFRVAVQDSYPSHGNLVRHANATTLFETWEAGSGSEPSTDMSMNHIMLGGQQPWYFSVLVGLSQAPGVEGAGWASVRVWPRVPRALAGAAMQLATDHGLIAVQWTQGNATALNRTRFALAASIPVGTRAELCVPTFELDAQSLAIHELGVNGTIGQAAWREGKYVATAGCSTAAARAGAVCFGCGSGSYTFGLVGGRPMKVG